MFDFKFETTREPGLLCFRASGYAPFEKLKHLQETMKSEIAAREKEGGAFSIIFDCRGLKALDPRTASAIGEFQKFLDECAATKIGTVFDSIVAQMQQMRVDETKLREKGRVAFFKNPEECRKWIGV